MASGQVENQVGVIRKQIFATLADLNAHLQARCEALAGRLHPEQKDRSIAAVFADERDHLRPPGRGFDGYTERQVRISSTCLARFDTNSYSVPSLHAGGRLSLRAYTDRIILTDGIDVIASHERSFERHRMIFDPWHYLPLLQKKAGGLTRRRPLQSLGSNN